MEDNNYITFIVIKYKYLYRRLRVLLIEGIIKTENIFNVTIEANYGYIEMFTKNCFSNVVFNKG